MPHHLQKTTYLGQTTAVGVYPQGASPYDVLDLAGNVWEWTSTLNMIKDYWDENNVKFNSFEARVTRGGSAFGTLGHARAASSTYSKTDTRATGVGFRLVAMKRPPTLSNSTLPGISRDIHAAKSLVYEADEHARLNEHNDAIQLFNRALVLDPLCAEALSGRGWSKYLEGDLMEARSDLDQSIKIDDWSARALYRRGVIRKAQGDYQGAIEDHNKSKGIIEDYEIEQADIARKGE